MGHILLAVVGGTLVAATPLIYAALGELVAERSGVVNLGVEGMMLLGAVTAFGVRLAGYSALPAVAAAALAGTGAALAFGLLALTLAANQYAVGLALTILGSGLSDFLGHRFGSTAVPPLPHLQWLPFAQDAMVYLALCCAPCVAWFLYRTKPGLILRSVGEAPHSAHALGHAVIRIRYAATAFGGAMAGVGGAYLSIVYTPLWVPDMTAGRGWIALALVVFASWRPGRLVLGAWLFGGVSVAQLFFQGAGLRVPSELFSALPYLATIGVLVMISTSSARRPIAPRSLALPFREGA